MSKLTRRALIGVGGVLVAGAAVYGAGLIGCRFVPRNVPDFFASLDGVDPEALKSVGTAVIRTHPEYGSAEHLRVVLASGPHAEAALQTTCPTQRLTHLQDQCRADFDADRTLIVDGWVISRTEAALCAQFA